jgi:vacuolar-type H+-ATPase subunit H
MSAANETRRQPEAEVSRAIDEVLAAEKSAGEAVDAAAAAAADRRHRATESAHRILARAEARIGAVHRKVTANLRAEIERLQREARDEAERAPRFDLDAGELDRLVAAAAEWLTTDGDH